MAKHKPLVRVVVQGVFSMTETHAMTTMDIRSASKRRIKPGDMLCGTRSGVRPLSQKTRHPRFMGIALEVGV